MNGYQKIDALIIEAIRLGRNPLYANTVHAEAVRLANLMNREDFRVVDGRLTALKKAKQIVHRSKSEAKKAGASEGWGLL